MTIKPVQGFAAEPRPQIPLRAVEGSSQIAAIGYDAEAQILAVRFIQGAGAIYHYPGVSQETYDAFHGAESLGKFFGQHIKPMAFDKYPPEPTPAP